jgi:fructokinase
MVRALTIGTLVADIINDAIDRILEPGEGILTHIEIHPGGCAFNVAVDLAKIREGRCLVGCVGAVGDDLLGDSLRSVAREHGVDPLYCECPGTGTSKNVILNVRGEERRHHYDPGANPLLSAEFVLKQLAAFGPALLYCGETASLDGIRHSTAQITQTARAGGALIFLDAVVGGSESWGDLTAACRHADVFHCNDQEAFAFTGAGSIPEALAHLVDLGVRLPVISQGPGELWWAHDSGVFSVPAFSVKCVDGTGAGDALMAGLMAQSIRDDGTRDDRWLESENEVAEAMIRAQAAAACAVTRIGCIAGVERDAIETLLMEQGAEIVSRVSRKPA